MQQCFRVPLDHRNPTDFSAMQTACTLSVKRSLVRGSTKQRLDWIELKSLYSQGKPVSHRPIINGYHQYRTGRQHRGDSPTLFWCHLAFQVLWVEFWKLGQRRSVPTQERGNLRQEMKGPHSRRLIELTIIFYFMKTLAKTPFLFWLTFQGKAWLT